MKTVLKILLALSLIPLLSTCGKKEVKKPKILFLLADDMSYPYSEIFGETYVKTPNIAKLAKKGINHGLNAQTPPLSS